MGRVTNEEFISHLTTLFSSSSSSGSIYLTSKRLTYAPLLAANEQDAQGDSNMASASASSSSSSSSFPLLFRLTNGKSSTSPSSSSSSSSSKATFSTQVSPTSLPSFQEALNSTMRTCLSGCLRKRDKAKERKNDKVLLARRKRDEELGGWKSVAKIGKKRGAGHRQHQRAQKRAMKLRREERVQASKAKASGGGDSISKPEAGGKAADQVQQSTQSDQTAGVIAASASTGNGNASKKKTKKKGGKK